MILHIQNLKRQGMTADELYAKHGIHERAVINNKVTFNYDMIDAKDDDVVAQQCRGLILEYGTWNVIACPFFRFFNYGQGSAATIDFTTAKCLEKLDGTLIIAHYYNGTWACGTRNLSEAQAFHNDSNETFADLVQRTCQEMGFRDLNHVLQNAPKNHTIIMELCTPENQIVCQYPKRELFITGARNNDTLQEVMPETLNLPLRGPKEWNFSNIDSLIEFVNTLSPSEFEGCVVRDANFNRIKVKSIAYVAAHGIASNLGESKRNIYELILSEKADDIKPLLSEYKLQKIQTAEDKIRNLNHVVANFYSTIKDIDNMKEFAGHAVLKPYAGILFALKRKKTDSIQSYLKNANIDHVIELCEKV